MYQWTTEERTAWLTKVLKLIHSHFDEGELQTLCFELGIPYGRLSGSSMEAKARELVLYCERDGQLDALIQKCRELRPKVDWPDPPLWIPEKQPKKEGPPTGEQDEPKRFPRRYLLIVVGVVIVGLGLAILGYYLVRKAPVVVDTMDSLSGWVVGNDSQSTIDISLAPGMLDKAMKVDYVLNQGGYVVISKAITKGLLSGTQSIKLYYMGTDPNTIELKLFYALNAAEKGEVFSYARRENVRKDDWVPFEESYSAIVCVDNCKAPGQKMDPAQVRRLEIAVSHQLGGVPGRGYLIVDQFEALK
jgi:hypothetical protein